jgi:glycosyltransferase involved in cell wall biosynthesis
MFSFGVKLIKFVREADLSSIILVIIWIVFFPALWLYARFYPRVSNRILFWSNEGFRVAPTRVRSYGFCREMRKLGVDASVLSFWDHLADYKGLIPFKTTLGYRTRLTLRAMMAAVRTRAGIIVFQRPFYEFMSILSLKVMYPRKLTMWLDVDDWIFDEPLTGAGTNITFRNMLAVYAPISEGCIVSSVRLQQETKKYFTRVEIIPTFPDPTLFNNAGRPNSQSSAVIFSWIGTLFMEQVKWDVLFLAEVLESLRDPRIVFQILGDGRYMGEVREKAEQIAQHIKVSFLGWVEPEAVPEYVKNSDVGLYCLRSRNDFCASKSPTKLFEYMACGKPTVSTNFGEATRFIEHGVTGFIASTKEDFAYCCSILLNDAKLRQTMGRNARSKIESEYNLSAAASRLNEILNVALGDHLPLA